MHGEMGQEPGLPRGVGITSLIIAQARAAESLRPDRLIDDPWAQKFVVAAGAAFEAESARNAELLRLRGDFIAVRTRFFDDYLLSASCAGCRQVVILAAGLDARAFRLAWTPGVTLYELDLPEVLAFKEHVLEAQRAAPACRRILVPVDLRQNWPGALLSAGFHPRDPTVWLLEGILMYLAEEERDHLLAQVRELTAPDSRLALDQRGAVEQRGERPVETLPHASEGRKETDAAAARLGVRIPGDQPAASESDLSTWLAAHGWSAQVFGAVGCFHTYGRKMDPAVEQAAAGLWLASADWAGPAHPIKS